MTKLNLAIPNYYILRKEQSLFLCIGKGSYCSFKSGYLCYCKTSFPCEYKTLFSYKDTSYSPFQTSHHLHRGSWAADLAVTLKETALQQGPKMVETNTLAERWVKSSKKRCIEAEIQMANRQKQVFSFISTQRNAY